MYLQRIVLFCLFFAGISQTSFSQVGVSQTSGCAPLQVNFTAPPGATSANWNFGNGTSPFLNPSNVYNTPGVYVVTYSGTGGNPTNWSTQITVTPNNVTASMSYVVPVIRCAPVTVNFTGTSNAPGSTFQWLFGDGGGGTGSSTAYAYVLGGAFNPTLVVTDPAGCSGTVTSGPINISTLPVVVITATPGLNSCVAPFTTSFTGIFSTSGSPTGPGLTYNWNFGNSQTSTQATPGNITYANQGFYNVVLTVKDDNNCSNSKTEVVTVIQPTLLVTTTPSLCVRSQYKGVATPGKVILQIQTSVPSVTVNFVGSNTVTVPTPVPGASYTYSQDLYTTPGLHTVVVVAALGNCVATQTLTIFSESITPQFSATPASSTCSPVFLASFVNQSTSNSGQSLGYLWIVDHWNNQSSWAYTSNAVNPTFTLTEQSLSPYAWYGMFVPKVYLEVTSALTCFAFVEENTRDTMWRPTAWFNKSSRQGCAPLEVRFRDSSSVSPIYPITSYTWNNGGFPAITLTGTVDITISPIQPINTPTFVYSAPGTYTPFLSFTTTNGCSAISFIDTVIVVDPVVVSPIVSIPSTVCVGVPLQINLSAAPSSTMVQHWHLESDAGFYSNCTTNSVTNWPFTHPGVHGFTLSAYNRGCKSDTVSAQTITVKGPVAKFRFQTNCTNKKSVDFSSFLQEVQTATLTYGDGNTFVMAGNSAGTAAFQTTHTYLATGDYTARIYGVNALTGCGASTQTMLVQIREIKAAFTVTNPIGCQDDNITFDATASVDVFTTCVRGYAWILDTLKPAQFPYPVYTTFTNNPIPKIPGTHTVILWVKDVNSCTDSITRTFVIDQPTASFTFATPTCLSDMPLLLVNTSPTVPVAPASYTWDFGVNPSTTLVATSGNINPTYNYTAAQPSQSYTISLIAEGNYALCRDTLKKVVVIQNPPEAYIYPYKLTPCVGPVSFNVPPYTYTVNFGDGSPPFVNTATTIAHTYTAAGPYTQNITIGFDGCYSYAANTVTVQNFPVTNFSISPVKAAYCAPETLTFTSTSSSGTTPLGYYWNLGFSAPVINSPTVLQGFQSAGVYTITLGTYPLVNISTKDCMTSVSKTLTVYNPTATPVIDRIRLCVGETIKLSMKDTNTVFAWHWYFGNGQDTTFVANPAPTPTLSYPYPNFPPPFGAAFVNLVYYASAYSCTRTATLPIQLVKVDALFNRNLELAANDSAHCLNLVDVFNNKSKYNNGTNVSSLVYNWNFGNGALSTDINPSYKYPLPGVYTVSLTVTDGQQLCTHSTVKNMTIFPIPSVSIAIVDSVCRGSDLSLFSTGSSDVSQYQWLPSQGLNTPNAGSTTVNASTSTTYSLEVSNAFGCKAKSDPQYVYVQQPAPTIRWDSTVIIGQVTQLNSNLGPTYTYTWSPLVDLSCTNCYNPVSTTTANITYSVEVEDNMRCFKTTSTYTVFIDPMTSIDVPTAFTPNGDGLNDVIYVDGWGIRKLNYFRIFNRWGQLLFESNDIKVGWDGTYNGVPQNMETYVYQVSAESYLPEKSLKKASSFRLIR